MNKIEFFTDTKATLPPAIEAAFNTAKQKIPEIPNDHYSPFKLGFAYGVLWDRERMLKITTEFAEWIDKNGYTQLEYAVWTSPTDKEGKTTTQLLELYVNNY